MDARAKPSPLPHESSAQEPLAPSEELVSRLHFDTREGRIWLNDQRMVLLHNSALGVFRQELIETLGAEKARGLLTRMGYNCFAHEAAKAHFNNDFSGRKAYLCGPPAMIDACLNTLMQGRLYERDIHTEKFLSAADAQRTRSPLFRSV